MHPLQLYYALLGIVLFAAAEYWKAHRDYEGQVFLRFFVLFFTGTFLLELMQIPRLHLNLILSGVGIVTTGLLATLHSRQSTVAGDVS